MFKEFVSISLYAIIGIFTWSYLMLFILNIMEDLNRVTTCAGNNIVKFGRKIGSHNYHNVPNNFA